MWMINFLMTTLAAAVSSNDIFNYKDLATVSTPAPEFYPSKYNVTFLAGELAVLSCSVANLGTKTVVWRKLDNSFPLTSGTMTVVADKRISVVHMDYKNQWDLLIKDVQPDDDGMYECQISSKDRTVRRIITLNVIEPEISEPDIRITETQYVERGESVVLECNATGIHHPPDEMDWFRNGQKLTTHSGKGIKIEKQFSFSKRKFTSVLTIDRASMEDDGTYVCRSSNMQITSTKVIVLNAETIQKKRGTVGQTDGASQQSGPFSSSSFNKVSYLVFALWTIFLCLENDT